MSATTRTKRRKALVYDVIRRGIAVVILVGALVGAYLYFSASDHAPQPEQAAAQAGPMPVSMVVVEPRDVPLETTFLGQTEPSQQVEIRARISGYLRERAFEEGQRVEQGQLLFRIDPEPYEVALAQAQAQLEAAEARLTRATQQLERIQSLGQAASVDELEAAQTELQVSSAQVALERARIEQARLDLSYTSIEAPITGVIGQALQDVGSYISPGSNAQLAVMRQVEPIYVRFSVSEQDISEMQRLTASGQVSNVNIEDLELRITLPDGRVYPHRGQINYVDVEVDPSTGTAVIRGQVPNPENALLPGQYVNITVLGVERLNAVLVPQKAVLQTPGGAMVYVANAENQVEQRPVTLGSWYEDDWIIESGLEAGDRVIVNRLMQLRPDTAVVEAAPQAPEGGAASTTQPADE